MRPNWTIGLLTAVAMGDLTKIPNVDFLAVNAPLATRSFVQSAHANDKQVYVWTVNDPISMSSMVGRGVDNIITDKPGVARELLEARKEMSVAERMLLEVAGLLGAPIEIGEQ